LDSRGQTGEQVRGLLGSGPVGQAGHSGRIIEGCLQACDQVFNPAAPVGAIGVGSQCQAACGDPHIANPGQVVIVDILDRHSHANAKL